MKKLSSIILFAIAVSLSVVRAQSQVLVIVNPSVQADSISKAELREVFTGAATRLKEGGRVVPALLKEGPAHSEFLSTDLGESPVALLLCWRGLVLSGQATMPKSFDSESAMVEYVAHTPGAIGYIAKATPHDGVKVLTVR